MNNEVISAQCVGKRYILAHQVSSRDGLRHKLESLTRSPLGWLRAQDQSSRQRREDFWALQDISFEVEEGEVLGIIGKNGAGKSTLLKILSRITEPTTGRIRLQGRVASLLEVGTGFHPELTGRENIFLNGAILGMSRTEIRRKFDDIVSFAEVERFLDTPVKRYSSGMYVRLAFAVAAHLEPEILIVDEVLAVGDAEFQERCLGKMHDVATGGRTILFVSHNMGAIQSLCQRTVVLDSGHIVFDGKTEDAIRHYLHAGAPTSSVDRFEGCVRVGTGEAQILSMRFEDDQGILQTHFRMGEPINIIVRANFPNEVLNPTFGINFMTGSGIMVADCRSAHYGLKIGAVKGVIEYRMRIDAIPLYPRTYVAEPWVADARCLSDFDWIRNAATFVVTSGPKFMDGANVSAEHGISHIKTAWNARSIENGVPSLSLQS